MWGAIIKGISSIFGGWVKVKISKQEAEAAYNLSALNGEQNWDLEAQRAAKHSWKDEIITAIWYSPMYVGWFDRREVIQVDGSITTEWFMISAGDWVTFVGLLPYWWQFGAFGIMAASFGLRWYFKQQNFKVLKNAK